jgi:uncharacterized protein
MNLDMLEARERQVALFERYASLLNDHQRRLLELHLRQDWSLGEIARRQSTSRAAVHDVIRRAARTLEDYERRLGLVAEERRRHQARGVLSSEIAGLRRRLARLEAELAEA